MAQPVPLTPSPPSSDPHPRDGQHAVIDVGSNSVRLVVFDRVGRVPIVAFNEKTLCGLGRGLSATGQLDPEGVDRALATLQRFARLIDVMATGSMDVVATAAVREAADGNAFVERVARECGLNVRVLSGREEAELSALGVIAGIPGADGLIGDLGGGSLELIGADAGAIGPCGTLPLGPLRLDTGRAAPSRRKIKQIVRETLGALNWLDQVHGKTLFAVGGSWRAIARLHMAQTDYPIRVVNRYAISLSEIQSLLSVISRQSRESLARIEGIPRRRLDSLPTAASIMSQLLSMCRPKQIVFCGYGLREGLVHARLDDEERRLNPLIVSCRQVAEQLSRKPGNGEHVAEFVAPLFPDASPRFSELCRAAAILGDIGWRQHPDYRAEQAFHEVLRMPGLAADHDERAFLALAVLHRYRPKKAFDPSAAVRHLIGTDRLEQARVLGLAIRLAEKITAGIHSELERYRLELDDQTLGLRFPNLDLALVGTEIELHLKALAQALGRAPRLVAVYSEDVSV